MTAASASMSLPANPAQINRRCKRLKRHLLEALVCFASCTHCVAAGASASAQCFSAISENAISVSHADIECSLCQS